MRTRITYKLTAVTLAAAFILSGCSNDINISIGDLTESGSEAVIPESNSEANSDSDVSLPEETDNPGGTDNSDSPVNSGDSADENPYTFEWRRTASWEAEGKICGGMEMVVCDKSGETDDGWQVRIEVPGGFEILAGWNAEYEVKDNVLIVKNVEYNPEIPEGGMVSFGFNYSAISEFTPKKVTFNGKQVQVTEREEQNNSGGDSPVNSEPETSAPETKAPETSAPETSAPETSAPVIKPEGTTAHVSTHGRLSVKGTQLVDKNGNPYQLRGMSTHGLGWFPDMINEANFRTLRDDWNTNVVRLAMYSGEGEGYSGAGKKTYEALMKKGIEICIKLDMYVIVDWHVLADQSPQVMKADALRFFDEITREYGKYPNLIYEICNEPNGYADWNGHVKPYAEEVIPIIRKNAPDSVIIVGTPTWSQDIDHAMNNPLKYDNIMYALHFYADTHTDWLRDRLKQCNGRGLPVMVTEFGCCDASGNGRNNFDQTTKWLTLLDSLGISYMNWSLGNKDETASALRPNATMDGKWDDSELSESGKWMRDWFRKH